MKNAFKNLKLWQKKRDELPISGDKNADWLEMHALLDKHMPVTTPAGKSGWLQSKKLKTIGLTFLSFSAAAMVYVVSHVYEIKNQNYKYASRHHGFERSLIASDSLIKKDSTTQIGSAVKRDTGQLVIKATNNNAKTDSLSLNVGALPKPLGKHNYLSSNEKLNDSVLTGNNIGKNSSVKNSTEKTITGVGVLDKKYASNKNTPEQGNVHVSVANGATNLISKPLPRNDKIANGNVAASTKNTFSKPKKIGFLSKTTHGTKSQATVNNKNYYTSRHSRQNTARVRSNLQSTGLTAYSKPGTQTGQNQDDLNSSTISGSPSKHRQVIHHGANSKIKDEIDDEDEDNQKNETLAVTIPKPNLGTFTDDLINKEKPVLNPVTRQKQAPGVLNPNKKTNVKNKPAKTKTSSASDNVFSKINWGLLVGVNASGSFTPKNQNSSFYGPAPVDLFIGVYANYNINAKWGINSPVKVFTPQSLSYNYQHLNNGQFGVPQLQITSARKIYSLEVPLQLSYRINNYLSVVAGPLISIPIKQAGISNKFNSNGVVTDSTYKAAVADTLSGTKYLQKLNFGLSTGVNIQYKRFIFGAMWNQSLSSYDINSAFGTYKTTPGTFQFTIGWQLDKPNQKRQ